MIRDRLPARIYFSILLEINSALANNSNPIEQLQIIFAAMKKVVPYDIASLFCFKKDINKLELLYKHGTPKSIVESVNFKLGKGGTWHAVKTQKPYLVKNSSKTTKPIVTSFVAIPIIFQKEILGVISLGNYNNFHYQKLDIITIKIINSSLINLLIFLNSYADSNNVS